MNEVSSATQGDADSEIDVLDYVVVDISTKRFHDRYATVLNIVDIVSFKVKRKRDGSEEGRKEGKGGEGGGDRRISLALNLFCLYTVLLLLAEVRKRSQLYTITTVKIHYIKIKSCKNSLHQNKISLLKVVNNGNRYPESALHTINLCIVGAAVEVDAGCIGPSVVDLVIVDDDIVAPLRCDDTWVEEMCERRSDLKKYIYS